MVGNARLGDQSFAKKRQSGSRRIVACRKEETEEIRERGGMKGEGKSRGRTGWVVCLARGTEHGYFLSLSLSLFLPTRTFDLLFATRAIISRGGRRSSFLPQTVSAVSLSLRSLAEILFI